MFNLSSPSWMTLALVVVMVSLQGAFAQDRTHTLDTHRRYTLAKRARQFNCGQIKSNSPQYPNVCICFDETEEEVNFGESPEAVAYANSQDYTFPEDTSNNGACQFPDGGPFTLGFFTGANKCCDFTCTYGSCGEGNNAKCLESNQICQSGVPVSQPIFRRDSYGARCPKGLTSCVVAQAKNKQTYECVDIQRDLESCGGCLYPDVRFGNSTASGSFGQDCSSLPNVAEVSCEAERCKIHTCNRGYDLKDDECVPSAAFLLQLNEYRL